MKIGDVIIGLLVLSKYEKNGVDAYATDAEHDQVWAGNCETPVSNIDRAILLSANWFFDRDVERWSFFT